MLRSSLIAAMSLTAILLAACQTSGSSGAGASAKTQLTGAEIQTLYTGNSFDYWGKTKGVSSYSEENFVVNDEANGDFSGSWRIKGDEYCRTFIGESEQCDTVEADGKGNYFSRGYRFVLKQ